MPARYVTDSAIFFGEGGERGTANAADRDPSRPGAARDSWPEEPKIRPSLIAKPSRQPMLQRTDDANQSQ